jgi:chemotaxis family two-component system sensor kinase Cph1
MSPHGVGHDTSTSDGPRAIDIRSGGHMVEKLPDPLLADLNSCHREPIHIPGSIQPHGLMLVARCSDVRVHHVAGDVEGRLGVGWEGHLLSAVLGASLAEKIAALMAPGAISGLVGQLQARSGEMLDVSAHLSGTDVIVELETASSDVMRTSSVLDGLAEAAAGFERSVSLTALYDRAAFAFRQLTGFDRVMVYRFLDDGAGCVVAENRREDLHSFLNQRFPASDIPDQARALYIRNLIRAIPDVSYQPAPLRPNWIEPAPLDMSDSSLRSVSPVHLQYLVNMRVKASASISIVKDGVLWGLIACHHASPRSLSYETRAACRSLAGSVARQIKAKEEAEAYRQRIRLRNFEDDVIALLSRQASLEDGLTNHLNEIRRMMSSDGVVILRGAELVMDGICPGESDIRGLAAWLLSRAAEPILATDRLSALYPPAAMFQHAAGGVFAVILSVDDPWILLWFNVEQIETVNWAGNPHKDPSTDLTSTLTPRASFEAWAETVSGRARAWTLPELDAGTRLRGALLGVQQNRRVQELNQQLTTLVRDKDVLLQQKEFLLGEINHRVQNSLAIVSAFLSLQARDANDASLREGLKEAGRRITAIGLVHRRLYRGNQIEMVDVARYIEELCADTFSFMGQDWTHHLTLNLAAILLPTDRAINLGLLLTELLINANKYAYAGAAGPIEITLVENLTDLRLIVADRGVGKVPARSGFGFRVLDTLVRQLRGTLTQSDDRPGLRIEVILPASPERRG